MAWPTILAKWTNEWTMSALPISYSNNLILDFLIYSEQSLHQNQKISQPQILIISTIISTLDCLIL